MDCNEFLTKLKALADEGGASNSPVVNAASTVLFTLSGSIIAGPEFLGEVIETVHEVNTKHLNILRHRGMQ